MKNKAFFAAIAVFGLTFTACNLSNTNPNPSENNPKPHETHQADTIQSVDNQAHIQTLQLSINAFKKDNALFYSSMQGMVETKPAQMPILEAISAVKDKIDILDTELADYISLASSGKEVKYGNLYINYSDLPNDVRTIIEKLSEQNMLGANIHGYEHQAGIHNFISGENIKKLMPEAELAKLNKADLQHYLLQLQFGLQLGYHDLLLYFLEKMGKLDIKFDDFQIFAAPRKSAIVQGEEYEVILSMGASSKQAKFSINVNGQGLPVTDGKAIYKTKPSTLGEQKYRASVTLTNPMTGETVKASRDFYFEVLPPR